MARTSKAVYLGNIGNEYCGFTVGNDYEIYDFEDGYIGVRDNNGTHLCIKNGASHKFGLLDDDHFITETECAVTPTLNDEKPKLRYYINGHEVDMIEFGNVGRTVYEFDRDGVKCDTIKFEVKFE